VIDALGSPGSLLLVGGTSDIAVATARRYLPERPLRVVEAARDTPRRAEVAAELTAAGADVQVVVPPGILTKPSGIELRGAFLYVSDAATSTFHVFSKPTGYARTRTPSRRSGT